MNHRELSHLDLPKAIQAVGLLLNLEHGERVGILRLMKLLYIADREALAETGRSITGDRYSALDHGPVLSGLYNIMKDEDARSLEWRKHFTRDRYYLKAKGDPGVGQLSRYEVRKLREVADRFSGTDVWDIVKHTHTFAEWKKNEPADGSSNPIQLTDVLCALGIEHEAERIGQELMEEAEFRRLLSKSGR
jgi:uncharacterized phage-associated protein